MHHAIWSCKLIHLAHGDLLHEAFLHSTNIYLTPSTVQVLLCTGDLKQNNLEKVIAVVEITY